MGVGRNFKFLKDLLVIEVSLVLSSTAAAPLKRVKLLMQNEEVLINCGSLSEPYKGILDCFGRTVKNEGFLSLWRGNSASLLHLLPFQAHYIIFELCFKKLFDFRKEEDGCWKKYVSNLVLKCASDLYSLLLLYSLDYARTKLANDVKVGRKGGERQFKGLIDVYRKTIKSDGLLGLYRGFGISCACVVVHRALFSGLTDILKPMVKAAPFLKSPVGWGTRIVATLGVYPMDTVRRRVMLTSDKHISSIATFEQIAAKGGLRSLFKGADVDVLSFLVAVAIHPLSHMKLLTNL